jgi:hypothetical protein
MDSSRILLVACIDSSFIGANLFLKGAVGMDKYSGSTLDILLLLLHHPQSDQL